MNLKSYLKILYFAILHINCLFRSFAYAVFTHVFISLCMSLFWILSPTQQTHSDTCVYTNMCAHTHTHTHTQQEKRSPFHLLKRAVVIDLWICYLFSSLHLSEIMYGSNLATDILENLFEIISAQATAVCLLREEQQRIIVCSLVKHSITAITLE